MPVGPEFQDPPEESNQLPYFVSPPTSMPFYEQAVTVSGKDGQKFAAKVADANLDDTLQVRWVANYPPFNAATTLLSPDTPDTSGARGENRTWQFMITVTCESFMQGADHNLVAIVSDRGFISPDAADAPAYVIRSEEPYNFDGQRSDDGKPNPQFVATMIGWRIAGCL